MPQLPRTVLKRTRSEPVKIENENQTKKSKKIGARIKVNGNTGEDEFKEEKGSMERVKEEGSKLCETIKEEDENNGKEYDIEDSTDSESVTSKTDDVREEDAGRINTEIFEIEDITDNKDVDSKKKRAMPTMFLNVGDPVRCTFDIHCVTVTSYAQFTSYALGSSRKPLFLYLLKILQKKVTDAFCTLGLQHLDTVLSIITHFETWQSSQKTGNIYIRLHGPTGNVLLMIDIPLFTITIKGLTLTTQGRLEMRPTLEDIIYERNMLKGELKNH